VSGSKSRNLARYSHHCDSRLWSPTSLAAPYRLIGSASSPPRLALICGWKVRAAAGTPFERGVICCANQVQGGECARGSLGDDEDEHSEDVGCEEENLADSDCRVVLSRHIHLHSHGRTVLYPAPSRPSTTASCRSKSDLSLQGPQPVCLLHTT
jgi:hypothetical protein